MLADVEPTENVQAARVVTSSPLRQTQHSLLFTNHHDLKKMPLPDANVEVSASSDGKP